MSIDKKCIYGLTSAVEGSDYVWIISLGPFSKLDMQSAHCTVMWDYKNVCMPKPCKVILITSGKNSNHSMTFKNVCENIETVLLSLINT